MGFNSKSPSTPRVLAIVVNWNKHDFLRALLASLRTLAGEPFDLLVVDNASSDGSPDMVRSEFPDAHLLETGANLGGTGGFNAGMTWGLRSENPYEFLWLMDNDIVVHDGALDGLVAAMAQDAKIGLVGSAILVMDDPNWVQEVGARIDRRTCTPLKNGHGPFPSLKRPSIFEADYAAACSALARVEAVRQTGIWDPAYFVQWDDIDWGERLRRAGWRIVGTTESQVRHESFDNRRAGQSRTISYLVHRNSLYYARKWFSGAALFRVLLFHLRYAQAWRDSHRIDGRHEEALAYQRAMDDFFARRMGPPPEELRTKVAARGSQDQPPEGAALGKCAFIVFDNSEESLRRLQIVRERLGIETFDCIVPDRRMAVLADERIPNKVERRTRTLLQRWLLGAHLTARYDTVFLPEYATDAFYLQFVANRILVGIDGTLQHRRRGFARIAMFALLRARATVATPFLVLKAMLSPLPEPDYFGFRK